MTLYRELLDNKSGNSSTKDRIELLILCLKLIGKEQIGLVIGDRKFVGSRWFKYMKDNHLLFIMRLSKYHLITNSTGRQYSVSDLTFKADEPLIFCNCQVDGIWGDVWVKALDKGEFLFLFGTAPVKFMGQFYRKRWTIEACFQNLKKRGFHLESTHLKCLKKLVALVSIAYSLCVSFWLYFHKKVQSIKVKNHGYKANSFSRYGLNQIRQMCRSDAQMCPDLRRTIAKLFRWINLQLIHYQTIKIAG